MSFSQIGTASGSWRRARQTNSTDANYRTVVAIKGFDNGPTGDGSNASQTTSKCILELVPREFTSGLKLPNGIVILPYGTGADATTMLLRVLGWTIVEEPDSPNYQWLWKDMLLGEFTCTLSTPVGIAGAVVDENQRFCDTIALVGTSGSTASHDLVSPATNLTGSIVMDLKGAHRVELNFDRNGSASSCNALYRWLY